jgi:cysteine-rich repeat protein
MRAPAKLTLALLGGAASLASCVLDLTGEPSGVTSTGGGGAAASATASASTGASSSASSGSSSGSTGGAAPVCGDAVIEGSEQCDDGNAAIGDGCSPTCTIEPLDACPGLAIPLVPPGITIQGTLVGAHDDLVPSCGGANHADVVYEVTPSASGTLTVTLTGNYEKSLSLRTSCADSATADIGCQAGSIDLVLTRWVYAGVKYPIVVDAGPHPFALHLDLSACGDGVRQGLEDCDNPSDKTCIGCFKCTGAGEVFDPSSRHCYRHVSGQAKSWQGARSDCLSWGGDLVGVSSQVENAFLQSKFNDVWSGANDIVDECVFRWSNGEPWQPHWSPGEPNDQGNEDCAAYYGSGLMNDTNCNDNRDALCERAPGGGCGDGIVQPGEECDDAITQAGFTCSGCVIACPGGQIEDPATHHCYELVTTTVDWNAAQADCVSKGAYLAAINSSGENGLLAAAAGAPLWVGGSRGGSFRWVNTDPFCYTNWGGNEPSQTGGQDCVTMQKNGTWTNDPCDKKKAYVCEHDN